MLVTSAAIPLAAVVAPGCAGQWRHRRRRPVAAGRCGAVLFDRDGTLVHDVPYNGDPDAGAAGRRARATALDRLRARGVRVGVVTNQSGVGRGLLTRAQVDAVNARVEELLGPFDTWQVCPHAPERRLRAAASPRPAWCSAAAPTLGVDAGALRRDRRHRRRRRGRRARPVRARVLVPTPVTRAEEVARRARAWRRTCAHAVDSLLLGGAADERAGSLAVRLDNAGDVLLAGPAVRAVAAGGDAVDAARRPARAAAAARCCPASTRSLVWRRAVDPDPTPAPVDPADVDALRRRCCAAGASDEAVDPHLVPPERRCRLALLLRLAGVRRDRRDQRRLPRLAARRPRTACDRRRCPRPERALLALAAAAGFAPARPATTAALRRARARCRRCRPACPARPYVVVHPGASVPARAWPPAHARGGRRRRWPAPGWPGASSPAARASATLTAARRRRRGAVDLGGRTDLAELAAVLAGADAVVVGNTGPAHLAAAVGTPVVSLFAPVVPAARWRPCGVPHVLLGDQDAACRGTPRPRLPGARPPVPVDGVAAPGGRGRARARRRAPGRRRRASEGRRMRILLWHVHGSWTTAFVQGRTTTCCPVAARPRAATASAGPAPGTGRRRSAR